MGTRLDLNDKADQLYEQAMLGISKIFVYRITRPWLSLHFVHYYLTFMGRLEIKLIETLHNFTNNVIKNRSNEFKLAEGKNVKKKRMAMLDLLLTAKKEGEIDLKGIQDEINTFMFEVCGISILKMFGSHLTFQRYTNRYRVRPNSFFFVIAS